MVRAFARTLVAPKGPPGCACLGRRVPQRHQRPAKPNRSEGGFSSETALQEGPGKGLETPAGRGPIGADCHKNKNQKGHGPKNGLVGDCVRFAGPFILQLLPVGSLRGVGRCARERAQHP